MKKAFLFVVALLGSIYAHANTELSKSEFTQAFVNKIEQAIPDSAFVIESPLNIKSDDLNGYEMTLNLENAYAQYTAKQKTLDALTATQIASMKATEKDFGRSEADNIFPVLKPRSYLVNVREHLKARGYDEEELPFYWHQLTDSVLVLYAFDTPENMRFATPQDVKELGLSDEMVRLKAAENLDTYFSEIELSVMKMDTHETGSLYFLKADDNYEASALLSDFLWSKDNFPVKGDFVAFVPARNMLIVVGSEDKQGITIASMFAEQSYQDLGYSISPRPFIRLNDTWHELP
ncbi:DUF1444 family protein [Spongorhabdus nitratireducens]